VAEWKIATSGNNALVKGLSFCWSPLTVYRRIPAVAVSSLFCFHQPVTQPAGERRHAFWFNDDGASRRVSANASAFGPYISITIQADALTQLPDLLI
jgi:hypothetical protein